MSEARRRARALKALHAKMIECRACPRLARWREAVARTKRRAYLDWTYWGRPVPGFGDPAARMVIVGLAPAAHGANRTGRMFTGDRSGDFLYAALHRAGFASQPQSAAREDGLVLEDAYVVNAARCAPPMNKPTPIELRRCAHWLDEELAIVRPRLYLALGAIGWNASLELLARNGATLPAPRPKFAHAAELALPDSVTLLGSFHVSQQNTQTGRLTPAMFDAVLARARRLLDGERGR